MFVVKLSGIQIKYLPIGNVLFIFRKKSKFKVLINI